MGLFALKDSYSELHYKMRHLCNVAVILCMFVHVHGNLSILLVYSILIDPWRDDPVASTSEEEEADNEIPDEDEESCTEDNYCICGCCKDTDPDIPNRCCCSDPCLSKRDIGIFLCSTVPFLYIIVCGNN